MLMRVWQKGFRRTAAAKTTVEPLVLGAGLLIFWL